MTEEQKQAVAVFRYGVIADFVGAVRLDRGEREALLRDKCARKWQIPHSGRTRLSRSTIIRWIQRYTGYGRRLESLYPQDRTDCGCVRAIDEETGLALQELRRQLPKMPVPELTRILHERQLVTSDRSVSQSTVYRFLHQHNLMTDQPAAAIDRRKFEAELPNDMWQSDVMHGPHVTVGDKQRKSYLIAFIDDHSRLILHAAFYPSEALTPFMAAFQSALGKRGVPRKLYVDNGSAFRSRQREYTCAALGISLIHAKPYQSQGKVKNPALYDHSLEAFSNPLVRLIEYDLDDLGQMTVPGETGRLYTYIDMTAQAEALYNFIKLIIEHDLVEELDFLANYDRTKQAIQEIVDMPDNRLIDLFVQLCLQNNGRHSARRKESHFGFLTDDELADMEYAVREGYLRN